MCVCVCVCVFLMPTYCTIKSFWFPAMRTHGIGVISFLLTHLLGMGGSPGDVVSEEPVTLEKRKKGWRVSCDVGEVTERLENEQGWRMSCDVGEVTHSPIFPSLHVRHSSFSNPSVALPTSQLILQTFRCFT